MHLPVVYLQTKYERGLEVEELRIPGRRAQSNSRIISVVEEYSLDLFVQGAVDNCVHRGLVYSQHELKS